MITLWLGFYLGHLFGFSMTAWWGFPLFMTIALGTVIELFSYVYFFGQDS